MQLNVKDFLNEHCQVNVFKAKSSTSYCIRPSVHRVYDKQMKTAQYNQIWGRHSLGSGCVIWASIGLNHIFHSRPPEPEWVNIVFVWVHRKKPVGGLSQSSNSMLLRGDMLCVIQRERKGKKKREGEAECQFTFHSSHYSSVTQASAQACLSHGIHTVLTTYSEVPHTIAAS